MTVHMWQLSRAKTIWKYIKPPTDKTDRPQNGIWHGMDEKPSKGVCDKGLDTSGLTHNWEHEMVPNVTF